MSFKIEFEGLVDEADTETHALLRRFARGFADILHAAGIETAIANVETPTGGGDLQPIAGLAITDGHLHVMPDGPGGSGTGGKPGAPGGGK